VVVAVAVAENRVAVAVAVVENKAAVVVAVVEKKVVVAVAVAENANAPKLSDPDLLNFLKIGLRRNAPLFRQGQVPSGICPVFMRFQRPRS
jgi:hypothetical protein